MNKKQKEEQLKLFADAFHEVVVPLLENMATKDDLKIMATKDDIEGLDKRLFNVEEKLEKIDNRLERYGNILDNQENRLVKLETKIAVAS